MDARPLRVCHLVATTLGARWMYEQLRELRDAHGYEVCAVVKGDHGPLVDWLKESGIRVLHWDFGLGPGPRTLALARSAISLMRMLWVERFDVVQTHVFPSYLAVRPAAWVAGVPVRASMISGPFHLEAVASRGVEASTAWMETAVIPSCVKSLTLCRELGIPESKLRLVYYAADPDRFCAGISPPANLRATFGWSEDTPLVGLVAYFYPRLGESDWIPRSLHGKAVKGHDDFIRAAKVVLQSHPNARFVLVGGGFAGDDSTLLEAQDLVKQLGLEGVVAFTGHRSDTPAVLEELTVAVQASLCENLGGTLEALAMAKPLVVTRVGGMVDVVRDGETGLVAEPRNPQDLADKISRMLADPGAARKLGETGLAFFKERFSIERCVQDLDALYRDQWSADASNRAYRFFPAVGRAMVAFPWLVLVWTRASLPRPDRSLLSAFVALPMLLARKIFVRIRSRIAVARAAAERLAYRAWTTLAPGTLRVVARGLRRRVRELRQGR